MQINTKPYFDKQFHLLNKIKSSGNELFLSHHVISDHFHIQTNRVERMTIIYPKLVTLNSSLNRIPNLVTILKAGDQMGIRFGDEFGVTNLG